MSPEAFINNLRRSKAGRVLLHVFLWLVYLSAMYYLNSISFNVNKGIASILEPLKNVITSIFAFYPLVYIIWPKYLARKKYFLGIVLVILLIILYTTIDHLLERAILNYCESCMAKIKLDQHGYYQLIQRGAINVIILRLITFGIVYQLFVFLAFPLTIKVVVEYFKQHVKTIRLEQENVQLEFNFLKSQVNPHFLFNTLNNIYALILKDDKVASAETVAKLASFMRYSLYESNTHSNNIVKEIDLLKVYIELERIRLNETVVNFISNLDDENYSLPPLLFMPAVENAFKYCGSASQGKSYIFLKLEVEHAQLIFVISNTFDKTQREDKLHSGIGLQNLQKRLVFYYPGDKSSMEITQDNSVFRITIHLKLA